MPARIQMHDTPHVLRPAHRAWILRSSDDKGQLGPRAGGAKEKLLYLGLAVGSVGPHVAHGAGKALRARQGAIALRIEAAVERHGAAHAEALLQLGQHGPAGEAEVDIEAGELVGAQIVAAAALSE